MTIIFVCPGNQPPGRPFCAVANYLYADVAAVQSLAAVYLRFSFLKGFGAVCIGRWSLTFRDVGPFLESEVSSRMMASLRCNDSKLSCLIHKYI